MKRVRVRRKSQEDLDSELFGVVQKTARHFVNDIKKLGRRYHHLRDADDDLGRLRREVESNLISLVGGHIPATSRKRNHKPSPKRVAVADWRDWQELFGDVGIVRTMPHDEGDPNVPAKVATQPSFWHRIIQRAVHH